MIRISYQVLQLGLKVRYIVGKDLIVEKTNKLEKLKKDAAEQILKDWSDKNKENLILGEYRRLHEVALGEDGIRYAASPEWFLKYIFQNKKFISINDVVDCYNLISVKYHVAIGSHDLDRVEGQLKFDLTYGTERFIPLGMTEQMKVPKGAYAFSDDKDVLCFLESRQCDKSKITLQTKNFITYIQGNTRTTDEYLDQAAGDLLSLYREYCSGSFSLSETIMMKSSGGGGS